MNICNVLQGLFVRVHRKEEEVGSRWRSERRGVCKTILHALFIFSVESAFCVFFCIFQSPPSSLPAYLHVSRSDSQFICEVDTIYWRDAVSLCHRVLHTRLLSTSVRPFVRPSVRSPPLYLPTTTHQPSQTSH